MRDYKSLGLPKTRAQMSDRAWNFCLGLVGVIGMLTVYGLVIDKPDRMVIMSRAEFDRQMLDSKIAGAREAFTLAQEERACKFLDHFKPESIRRKGEMK